jgi:hypothetical protein
MRYGYRVVVFAHSRNRHARALRGTIPPRSRRAGPGLTLYRGTPSTHHDTLRRSSKLSTQSICCPSSTPRRATASVSSAFQPILPTLTDCMQQSSTKLPNSCPNSKPTLMRTSYLRNVCSELYLSRHRIHSQQTPERKQLLEELKVHGRSADNADPIFTEDVCKLDETHTNSTDERDIRAYAHFPATPSQTQTPKPPKSPSAA